jgi:hypothetical protein
MTKQQTSILLLVLLILAAPAGFYLIQTRRIASSVVFQDSDNHRLSINLAAVTEANLRLRLSKADPELDARRALSVRDWRLAAIAGHHGAIVPGFQPAYAAIKNSIRFKFIAYPPDEESRKRAESYCVDYNAVVLRHVTGKLE